MYLDTLKELVVIKNTKIEHLTTRDRDIYDSNESIIVDHLNNSITFKFSKDLQPKEGFATMLETILFLYQNKIDENLICSLYNLIRSTEGENNVDKR